MKICNIPQQIFNRIDRIQICKTSDFDFDLVKDLQKNLPSNINSDSGLEKSLIIRCLPENLSISNTSKSGMKGVYWSISISLDVVDQLNEDRNILDKFQNKRCFAILHSMNHKIVLGNSDQFLKFAYSEKNSSKPQTGNSYTIKLKGIALHNNHIIEN